MAEIRLEGIRKTFGKVTAVRDVTLTVRDREFVVLLGPSGCGKTTLLRCVAELERPDRGRICIGGEDVTDLPPRRRRIAMVFQSYAVFPHLTVFENIAFGLRMQKRPHQEIKKRVQVAAELLQIAELLERYPSQLSGGQRQRVAVARAIVVEPEVLLMDEPLSNLDALLRLQMRAELKRLLHEIQTTTVYVTHDQVEALSLGDYVAILKEGEIIQHDTPMRIYDEPATVFVGGFIGNPPMNFLKGSIEVNGDQAVVSVGGHHLAAPPSLKKRSGETVLLGIRAENIHATTEPAREGLSARVLVIEPLGSHLLLTVQVGSEGLKVIARNDFVVEPQQGIWLRLEPGKVRWMNAQTGEALV
ncbi:MAG: ABC transporter ATP-binding protein [Chloroflexi bacterium]|nr:ABC transporter ATP-binding protein [Chloroflexota bacterium]